MVFLPFARRLEARDAATGATRWRAETGGRLARAAVLAERLAAGDDRAGRRHDVPGRDGRGPVDAAGRRAGTGPTLRGGRPRLRAPGRRPGARARPGNRQDDLGGQAAGQADLHQPARRPDLRRVRRPVLLLPGRRHGQDQVALAHGRGDCRHRRRGRRLRLLRLARRRPSRRSIAGTATSAGRRPCLTRPPAGPFLSARFLLVPGNAGEIGGFRARDGKAAGTVTLAGEPSAVPRFLAAPDPAKPGRLLVVSGEGKAQLFVSGPS